MSDIDREREERIRTRAYFLWHEAGSPEGGAEEFWHQARRLELEDDAVDLAGIESFPASDPPSHTPIVGPESSPPKKAKKRRTIRR